MNTDQLVYFIEIAHTQHLTHAAESLNISQPALSSSITRLEDELGVKLFDRKGRNIYLNHFGEAFLPYAQRAVASITTGKKIISELSNQRPSCTVQASNLSMFPGLLDNILSAVHNISIIHSAVPPYELEMNLLSGQSDMCFTKNKLLHSSLDYTDLYTTGVFFIASLSDPLSAHKFVKPEDLLNEAFVDTGNYSFLKHCFNTVYNSYKTRPALHSVAINFNEAIEYISKGIYVSFMSNNLVKHIPDHIRNTLSVIPIKLDDGSAPQIIQRLYWKKGPHTSAVNAVRDMIIEYFKNYSV